MTFKDTEAHFSELICMLEVVKFNPCIYTAFCCIVLGMQLLEFARSRATLV